MTPHQTYSTVYSTQPFGSTSLTSFTSSPLIPFMPASVAVSFDVCSALTDSGCSASFSRKTQFD